MPYSEVLSTLMWPETPSHSSLCDRLIVASVVDMVRLESALF